jgi:voltage-gated potassium channel
MFSTGGNGNNGKRLFWEALSVMNFSSLLASFFRLHVVIRLLFMIFGVLFSFGAIAHIIEPESFSTLFEGIWWAIVTASTVGYGDLVPITLGGKIIAMILILSGAGFVTYYMAQISSHVVIAQNAVREGKHSASHQHHIVIVGWNTKAKNVIQQIHKKEPNKQIVLIDRTLRHNPLPEKTVHFIRGDSTQDETLQKANVAKANMLLITADQNKNELQADMYSVLTLIAAKGIQSELYAIVEILTKEQVNNAWRAGANEVLESNMFMSHLMTNTILEHGMADTVLLLLDQLNGGRFAFVEASHEWTGKTYQEALMHFLSEEQLVVGIKRDTHCFVNPSLSFPLLAYDQFLIIKK